MGVNDTPQQYGYANRMAMENFQEVNEIDQTVNLEQNLPNSIGQIPH